MFRECSFTSVKSVDVRNTQENPVFVPMFRECSFTVTTERRHYYDEQKWFSSLCLGNVLSPHIRGHTLRQIPLLKFSSLCLGNVLSLDAGHDFDMTDEYFIKFSSLCLGNVLSPLMSSLGNIIVVLGWVFVPMFRECSFTSCVLCE